VEYTISKCDSLICSIISLSKVKARKNLSALLLEILLSDDKKPDVKVQMLQKPPGNSVPREVIFHHAEFCWRQNQLKFVHCSVHGGTQLDI
jgi:hypothetical protein